MYHRVAEVNSDPWSLGVTPRHFAEHLEVLRKLGRPVPLRRLSRALLDADFSDRPVALTFDDGYADNLHAAKPVLERHDVPATVFVASGYVGGHEFWWDELERLLLRPGTLPKTLRLSIGGRYYDWELGYASHYGEDAYQRHRHWVASSEDDPSPRHSLYRMLHRLLQPLPEDERRAALDELVDWSGAEAPSYPAHRPLSLPEVSDLEQGGLIEVGAHTVTHPLLSVTAMASQRDEIGESKTRLEEAVGHPVTSFAYPYGGYVAETVDLVREAGFERACSTFEDTVRRRADRFRLPRVEIQDWNGEEFARRLSRWLGA